MNFLAQIARCNQFSPETALPFFVENQQIGWVKHRHATILHSFSHDFIFPEDKVQFHPRFATYEERTMALRQIVSALKKQGCLLNEAEEIFDIAPAYGEKPLFALARDATAFFGVPGCGTHVNGFTYHDEQLFIWVARRSTRCVVAPGRLDNLSAGGLPKGTTPLQNVIKESWEEARLPAPLSKKAVPCGQISYLMDTPRGVRPDTILIFDLELAPTVIPMADGIEVDSFACLPATQVYDLIKNTQEFKHNSALVMIDFLMRKNIITAREPDYAELKTHLQRSFLFQKSVVSPDISV
jgi:8-oxo-dGTP pyrophosphatase MutT (NUDIX family)